MATIAGKSGDITAANHDAYCHAWTLDVPTDILEDTNWDVSGVGEVDAGWKTYIAGLTGWSGSFECYADATPATSILPGATVAIKLYVDKANTKGYSGNCIVGACHPGVDIAGIATISFDYTGVGKLTVGAI